MSFLDPLSAGANAFVRVSSIPVSALVKNSPQIWGLSAIAYVATHVATDNDLIKDLDASATFKYVAVVSAVYTAFTAVLASDLVSKEVKESPKRAWAIVVTNAAVAGLVIKQLLNLKLSLPQSGALTVLALGGMSLIDWAFAPKGTKGPEQPQKPKDL